MDGKPAAISEGELCEQNSQLGAAALKLLIEEIQYDERCLQVHMAKQQSFMIRSLHQKTDWQKKRQERAREAITKWWESKARPTKNYQPSTTKNHHQGQLRIINNLQLRIIKAN